MCPNYRKKFRCTECKGEFSTVENVEPYGTPRLVGYCPFCGDTRSIIIIEYERVEK